MNKLFCLIGKSGSGKDTILKKLCNEYGFKQNIAYTTRPKRAKEINGINYHFITDEEMKKMISDGVMIEVNSYHTKEGIWSYGTHQNILNDLMKQNLICIKEPNGFKEIASRLGYMNVVPIIIYVDGKVRLNRCLNREDCNDSICYEICRRYVADDADFEDILKQDLYYVDNNGSLEDSISDIINYIKSGNYKYYKMEV